MPPNVEQRLVDFDNLESLGECMDGASVFCALGTTIKKAGSQAAFRTVDLEYPRKLAERAAAAGTRQFLAVSSVGAGADSTNFYLKVKGEMEQAVSAQPFEAVHIFRPSLILGDRPDKRTTEQIASALAVGLSWMLAGGLRKYKPARADHIAAAMIEAAEFAKPGRHVYHYDEIEALNVNDERSDSRT